MYLSYFYFAQFTVCIFVLVEDDNWYSSDEEDQKDSKKLTDVLKNINRQVSTNNASYLKGILQVHQGSS